MRDPESDLYLSVASAWEIAIKVGLGRLTLPSAPGDYFERALERSGVTILGIELTHAARVAELPLHHRDPFDRLLVAQAQIEALTLVTADVRLTAYDIDVVRA